MSAMSMKRAQGCVVVERALELRQCTRPNHTKAQPSEPKIHEPNLHADQSLCFRTVP